MALRRARHARVSSAGLSVRTGACVRFKRRRSLSASRLIPGIVRRGEYLAFAPRRADCHVFARVSVCLGAPQPSLVAPRDQFVRPGR